MMKNNDLLLVCLHVKVSPLQLNTYYMNLEGMHPRTDTIYQKSTFLRFCNNLNLV